VVDPGTDPTAPVVDPTDPAERPIDIGTPPIYVPAQPGSNPTQPVVPQPAAPVAPVQPVVPSQAAQALPVQSPATFAPLAPAQIAAVTELIASFAAAERTPVLAWTPATPQTQKIDETLRKGTPGAPLQSLVPSTSTAGSNGPNLNSSAAPAVVPTFSGIDLPGATFTRAEFDSEIPASISQTVPVPPG
jgi:hypothetical protein